MDILLVDDRKENLLTLEAVLVSPDYHLVKANSGDEALRYLLTHDPALILMDVQMPNMDGFEAAYLIKKNERTREIPIIFITAINKDERYVHKGYAHGAVDYLYKPYDVHILKSKVAVFVELAKKTKMLLHAEKQLLESERRERQQQVVELELRSLRREQADREKYRDLVDGIDNGIVWTADLGSLKVSFVSPSVQRILGYPVSLCCEEEHFLAKHIFLADREKAMGAFRTIHTEKKHVDLECRVIAADSRVVWFCTSIRVAQKRDESGYELRALSMDITQLKEAEETLQLNKMRSDFLAEASLLLSESLDYEVALSRVGNLVVPEFGDWYLIHAPNDRGKWKLFSVASDPEKEQSVPELANWMQEVSGLGDLTRGNSSVKSQSSLYRVIGDELSKAINLREDRIRAIKALGKRSAILIPLNSRGRTLGLMMLISSEGRPRYDQDDLSMLEDLARRVAAAIDNVNLFKQAQAAIQVRDEFLSIASHELKTPLTPLKIQTQGLMRVLTAGTLKDVKPEKLARMLQVSDRQLGKLSGLIDDLLDISRIRNGRLSLNIEEFDLVVLVREILDRFNGQLSSADCEVELKANGSLLVQWDHFRIEQVVINLLTNAMKYGPGRPIEISVWAEADFAKISFRDHGIGIAKEDQERIFDRFERAVSGSYIGGLGLGLYIVTQILKSHDGKISVESQLGIGSMFTIEIPIKVESERSWSIESAV